jgi:hypothetical protein
LYSEKRKKEMRFGSTIGFLLVPGHSPKQHDRIKNQLTVEKDKMRSDKRKIIINKLAGGGKTPSHPADYGTDPQSRKVT